MHRCVCKMQISKPHLHSCDLALQDGNNLVAQQKRDGLMKAADLLWATSTRIKQQIRTSPANDALWSLSMETFTVNITPIWQMCDWHGFRKWHYQSNYKDKV